KNRLLNHLSMNPSACPLTLLLGDIDQCLVGNGFYETVAQRVKRCTQGADVFRRRYVLLGLRANCAVIHNRAAGDRILAIVDKDCRVHEVAVFIYMPHAQFGDLAASSTIGVFMATDARGCVINRSQPGPLRMMALRLVIVLIYLLIERKGV